MDFDFAFGIWRVLCVGVDGGADSLHLRLNWVTVFAPAGGGRICGCHLQFLFSIVRKNVPYVRVSHTGVISVVSFTCVTSQLSLILLANRFAI